MLTRANKAGFVEQFHAPIRRTTLGAWWDSRKAVVCGVALAVYIRYRLTFYLKRKPQGMPLPLEITVKTGTGEIVTRPNDAWERDPLSKFLDDPAGVDITSENPADAELRWVRGRRAAEAVQLLRDLEQAEEEASQVEHKLREAAENVSEKKQALQEEVADDSLLPAATLGRSPTGRGRPELPTVSHVVIPCLFMILFTVLSEAYNFAIPWFETIGIDRASLALEWQRDPYSIVTVLGYCLGASLGLLFATHIILSNVCTLEEPHTTLRQKVFSVAKILLLGSLVIGSIYIGALMRHGTSAAADLLSATVGEAAISGGVPTYAFLLLSLILLLGAAFASHCVVNRLKEWKEVQKQIRIWNQEEEEHRRGREKHMELINALERERAALEAQRDAIRQKIRSINERAQTAEREIRREIDKHRRFAEAFVNALLAALETDSYYYERHYQRALKKQARAIAKSSSKSKAQSSDQSPSIVPVPPVHKRPVDKGNGSDRNPIDYVP